MLGCCSTSCMNSWALLEWFRNAQRFLMWTLCTVHPELVAATICHMPTTDRSHAPAPLECLNLVLLAIGA